MDTEYMLKYLTELSKNNNREWYHVHKAENRAANWKKSPLRQSFNDILRYREHPLKMFLQDMTKSILRQSG